MNHLEGSVELTNEHNRFLLRGHWERLHKSTRSDARRLNLMLVSTQLLLLSIASVLNMGLIEFASEAENPEKKSRPSRQPSSLDSRPLAVVRNESLDHSTQRCLDCLHERSTKLNNPPSGSPTGTTTRIWLSAGLWKLELRGFGLRCRQILSTRTEES